MNYIFIRILPISSAKNCFRKLAGVNQIKLVINTKGLIQILNNNFNQLTSTVKVNNREMTLLNRKLNLTVNSNTVILIWDSPITDCSNIFNGITNINEVDLSSFTSSTVVNMGYMFSNCIKLSKITFTNFITSNTSYMEYMFNNCSLLTNLDLSGFNTSKVVDISYMFNNCTSLRSLKLAGFSNRLTTNMRAVFQNCTSLSSLDLSEFYVPKAEVIWDMFNGCKSLTSLNLSTFDTSQVTDMESMFDGCQSLVSLDLNHFQTSKVEYLNKMFRNCKKLENVYMKNINVNSYLTMNMMINGCIKLKYINLFSIDQTANNINDMFNNTSNNFTFCIEDETRITSIFNLLLNLPNIKRDCSDKCYTKNYYYNPETKKCISDCSYNNTHKYFYKNKCYISCPPRTNNAANSFICEDLNCNYYNFEQTGCITTIENGFFINSSLGTIDRCHEDCLTCNQKGTSDNANCLTCPEGKFYNYGNCISNCTNGYYEENSLKKCKCSNIKCFECSLESLDYDLCITCNENYFPKFEENNTGIYINCYQSPEGYYLDGNYYIKCYESCSSCYGAGDLNNNNCQNCTENHFFLNDFQNDKNCYPKCPYNYYFDNNKKYFCTENAECPQNYNKFISEKNKCIDKCSNDNEYRYEYRNNCLKNVLQEQKIIIIYAKI